MDIGKINAEIEKLVPYVTKNKQHLIKKVLADRTRHVTLLLEDLFHEHNASAVIRTADCYGIQEVHAVEKHHRFRLDQGIDKGASKWVDLKKYGQMDDCVKTLRNRGYTIVAATPHSKAKPLSSLAIDKPMALVFGAERVGLSDYVMEHADKYITIPMFGFTQSFNVSVSAAICLEHIMTKLRASDINWRLSETEQLQIKLEWYRRLIGLDR